MKNRREFLKNTSRSFLLALFGFGVVYGIRRKKITPEAKAACELNPGCEGCGKLKDCSENQAKEFKRTRSVEKEGT